MNKLKINTESRKRKKIPAIFLLRLQLVIEILVVHELRVAALLQHPAVLDHGDLLRVLNGGQAVSNDYRCAAKAGLVQRVLHHLLGLIVQS
jgi:hypothetical protein